MKIQTKIDLPDFSTADIEVLQNQVVPNGTASIAGKFSDDEIKRLSCPMDATLQISDSGVSITLNPTDAAVLARMSTLTPEESNAVWVRIVAARLPFIAIVHESPANGPEDDVPF